MTIPTDYLERVYAGVLGKLIGVYLGRPFEQWTHQRIMKELGPIQYYVHEQLGDPLVVTDDDVAGTFTFIRALEDYGISPDLSAEDIGKAWLNYIVQDRSILWWGGNGNSTEHTAWLNLKKGIPAPASGSIQTNGTTVAEQIGAQIFIDGWAMVAPGQPELAARLAGRAGSVSHDGEAVYAAQLWAAMEAEAFRSKDIDHLLDTGLSTIPKDCHIAALIADIRRWHRENDDWLVTRQLIEDNYGYAKYPGNCHVVPNHALMIMTVLYAPHDFQRAQMIVNTSGWDTDCNAGNVGCLLGIMLGLEGLDAGPDWRGPIADRLLISSADGGNSINDAVRMAYYIANLGRQLNGQAKLESPKHEAQLHFSLPGSQQGFRAQQGFGLHAMALENVPAKDGRALKIDYRALARGQVGAVTTPTFSPPEMLKMRTYNLMATPLIYPGQTLRARVSAPAENRGAVAVRLRLRAYDSADLLEAVDGTAQVLAPGEALTLEWTLPQLDGQPIAEVGIAIACADDVASGAVLLDWMAWEGVPQLALHRPGRSDSSFRNLAPGEGCDFWRMAWVNGASLFSKRFPPDFRISQETGEGIILHGTREWTDYSVRCDLTLHLGDYGGVAVRAQGLRRYYAARLTRDGTFQIVRQKDGELKVLAETDYPVELEKAVSVTVDVRGTRIHAQAGATSLEAFDTSFADGAMGLLVFEGALSTDKVNVGAASSAPGGQS
ncbi:ADP-ribosylglycohydrolase family protein [uncultured Devosia sp.]|uniref:ADP-ribosylglycohydrolase family protein n=1 Tax=uncultured Devosia sp. TaxID=211434 RepID=UPI0035C9F9BD